MEGSDEQNRYVGNATENRNETIRIQATNPKERCVFRPNGYWLASTRSASGRSLTFVGAHAFRCLGRGRIECGRQAGVHRVVAVRVAAIGSQRQGGRRRRCAVVAGGSGQLLLGARWLLLLLRPLLLLLLGLLGCNDVLLLLLILVDKRLLLMLWLHVLHTVRSSDTPDSIVNMLARDLVCVGV